MSIVKRADLKGKMVTSELLLECPKCEHKDIGKPRKCPVCGTKMVIQQDNSLKD